MIEFLQQLRKKRRRSRSDKDGSGSRAVINDEASVDERRNAEIDASPAAQEGTSPNELLPAAAAGGSVAYASRWGTNKTRKTMQRVNAASDERLAAEQSYLLSVFLSS